MSRKGRPTHGNVAKNAPLNMRTSPELRQRIEDAAEANGRSLTQEVERRLITSFTFDEARGGAHINAFTHMAAAVIHSIEAESGHRWIDDFDTFTSVRGAITRLVQWKNPGVELSEHFRLGEALDAANSAWTDADANLWAFRKSKGLHVPSEGVLGRALLAEPTPTTTGRKGWTDQDYHEEAELERTAADARGKLDQARGACDDWMTSATSRIEIAESHGQNVADAVFQSLGPRG